MGSLMAGWDSPVSDRRLARNKSLLNEEIEAYWREKKKTEEEHLKAISPSAAPVESQEEKTVGSEINFQRSNSMPQANSAKVAFMNKNQDTSLEDFIKKTGWWTRSKWAFLNEPPVLESSANSYRAQYHIANLAAPKPGSDPVIPTH